ncbi:MAG: AAA family ATPase, partial [Polynucleobacter sp.]
MPSKPGFFITGTDTEVGKTLVSGALILKLQEQFSRVGAYKPMVAGLQ